MLLCFCVGWVAPFWSKVWLAANFYIHFGWEMSLLAEKCSSPRLPGPAQRTPNVDQTWLLPSSCFFGVQKRETTTGFTISSPGYLDMDNLLFVDWIWYIWLNCLAKIHGFSLRTYESSMSFLAKGSWHFHVPHRLLRFAGLFWLCRVGGRAGKLNGPMDSSDGSVGKLELPVLDVSGYTLWLCNLAMENDP